MLRDCRRGTPVMFSAGIRKRWRGRWALVTDHWTRRDDYFVPHGMWGAGYNKGP